MIQVKKLPFFGNTILSGQIGQNSGQSSEKSDQITEKSGQTVYNAQKQRVKNRKTPKICTTLTLTEHSYAQLLLIAKAQNTKLSKIVKRLAVELLNDQARSAESVVEAALTFDNLSQLIDISETRRYKVRLSKAVHQELAVRFQIPDAISKTRMRVAKLLGLTLRLMVYTKERMEN